MPRNVGPTRLEAQIGKEAKRHGDKLLIYVGLVVTAVLGYLSVDYASSYSGVIEAVGMQEVTFRGRKNRGVRKVREKCLSYRAYGEAEARVDCKLPQTVLDEFQAGDRFVKPRFVSRPFPVRPRPTGPAEPGE